MHHNILRQKQSSNTKIKPSNTFCDIRLQPRDVDNYASTSTCYDCNVVTFKNQKKFFALHVVTAGPEHLAVDCLGSPNHRWILIVQCGSRTVLYKEHIAQCGSSLAGFSALSSRHPSLKTSAITFAENWRWWGNHYLQEGWLKSVAFSFGLVRYFWVGPKIQNPSWGPLIGSSYDLASWLLPCEPKIGPRW